MCIILLCNIIKCVRKIKKLLKRQPLRSYRMHLELLKMIIYYSFWWIVNNIIYDVNISFFKFTTQAALGIRLTISDVQIKCDGET